MNSSRLSLIKRLASPLAAISRSSSAFRPQLLAPSTSWQPIFRPFSTEGPSVDDQKQRVQQINDYFNQYIDEYYEEEDVEEVEPPMEEVREFSEDFVREKKEEISADEVVEVLERLRAKNIEVIDIDEPNAPFKQLVIASPYTNRHAWALIEQLRLHFVKRYDFGNRNPSRINHHNGWFILDCHNLVVHIMGEEQRDRYDLSNIWKTKTMDDVEREMMEDGWIPPQKPNETARYTYQRPPVA
ncbi:unnamed protein product [Bursaphelenchus xylophilus]|nr:unnamed protein product [Bursaphelenchus xylophilus]CAG9128355.1 unnamed protein product [Bursaphelenchus xylophilus]